MSGVLAVLSGLALLAAAAATRPRTARTRFAVPPAAARLSGRRVGRRLDSAFPDALDLFVVTVQAGRLPLDALRDLAPLVDRVVGDAFADVAARVERGERRSTALSALADALGPRGATFVETLSLTEEAGLPLAPALDRLADDASQHRRRQAEAHARQLPVRLSFPLVLCTLTSFVLVAIVPLLLGALTSFDRSSP